MLVITHPVARRIAVATLLGAIGLAGLFISILGHPAPAAAKSKAAPADAVEERIKTLHANLHITEAQEILDTAPMRNYLRRRV